MAGIQEIKLRHPFWAYRRVLAWLQYREDLPVQTGLSPDAGKRVAGTAAKVSGQTPTGGS
jgi:hypothetical protein